MDTDLELMIAAIVAIAAGIGLTVVALRQRAGRLRRNWFVGLRTPATLRDDGAWRAAHAATGGLVLVAGPLMVAGGMLALALPSETATTVALAAGIGLAVVLLLGAAVRGHRAARRTGG
jgi:uncharacterized membrane protein